MRTTISIFGGKCFGGCVGRPLLEAGYFILDSQFVFRPLRCIPWLHFARTEQCEIHHFDHVDAEWNPKHYPPFGLKRLKSKGDANKCLFKYTHRHFRCENWHRPATTIDFYILKQWMQCMTLLSVVQIRCVFVAYLHLESICQLPRAPECQQSNRCHWWSRWLCQQSSGSNPSDWPECWSPRSLQRPPIWWRTRQLAWRRSQHTRQLARKNHRLWLPDKQTISVYWLCWGVRFESANPPSSPMWMTPECASPTASMNKSHSLSHWHAERRSCTWADRSSAQSRPNRRVPAQQRSVSSWCHIQMKTIAAHHIDHQCNHRATAEHRLPWCGRQIFGTFQLAHLFL